MNRFIGLRRPLCFNLELVKKLPEHSGSIQLHDEFPIQRQYVAAGFDRSQRAQSTEAIQREHATELSNGHGIQRQNIELATEDAPGGLRRNPAFEFSSHLQGSNLHTTAWFGIFQSQKGAARIYQADAKADAPLAKIEMNIVKIVVDLILHPDFTASMTAKQRYIFLPSQAVLEFRFNSSRGFHLTQKLPHLY